MERFYCLSQTGPENIRNVINAQNETMFDEDKENCSYEFARIAVGSLFIYVTMMIQVYLRLCGSANSQRPNAGASQSTSKIDQHRYSLHSLIWILMILCTLVSLVDFGEVVIIGVKQSAWLPVSAVASIIQLCNSFFVPLCFNSLELGSVITMIPLLLHCLCLVVIYGAELAYLEGEGFNWNFLRYWTCHAFVQLHSCLLLFLILSIAKRLFIQRNSIRWSN